MQALAVAANSNNQNSRDECQSSIPYQSKSSMPVTNFSRHRFSPYLSRMELQHSDINHLVDANQDNSNKSKNSATEEPKDDISCESSDTSLYSAGEPSN